MKRIQINTSRYPEDVERIQKVLEDKGYEASLSECETLWDKYSDSMCASWMNLPDEDNDVFGCINSYIIN